MGYATTSATSPATTPIPTQSPKRLLFVSYSHCDSKQALRFRDFLQVELRNLRQLGQGDWEIFFDRDGIRAGEGWNEVLADKLAKAHLLVFLVSVDSLNSTICREIELRTAVERRIKVVPILLSPCPWERQVIPGDDRLETLSAKNVWPKGSDNRPRGVSTWRPQDAAWNNVLEGLNPWLVAPPEDPSPAMAGPVATPGTRQPRHVPPLLPYLCDQKAIWEKFDLALGQWRKQQGRALIVIVKGTQLDEPKQFWNRLRELHLPQVLNVDKSTLVDAALDWPDLQDRRLRPDMIAGIVRMKLSSALSEQRNPHEIDSPERLAQELARFTCPRPLVADFPKESPTALRAGLRALLGLLDACPEGTDLSRLLIVVTAIDQPELLAANLVSRWRLDDFRRSKVVEVGPLLEVTSKHADKWHDDLHLKRDWNLDKQSVLDLFRTASCMRAGQFAAAVRSMLEFPDSHTPKETA
jgi:hypothetical protein